MALAGAGLTPQAYQGRECSIIEAPDLEMM